jgi:hypothetical protein
MNKYLYRGLLLSLIILISPGLIHSAGFNLSGYYKTFFVIFDPPRYEPDGISFLPDRMMGLVNNRLRVNWQINLKKNVSLTLAYSFSPRIQDPLLFNGQLFIPGIELYNYRAIDFKRQLYPPENTAESSVGFFHNLDRAFFSLRLGKADIFIGRQAIAWGSSRILSPTDVIAPFTFEELDREYRIGVDAIRVRVPLGFMGELDGGWVFGENFHLNRSAAFLRTKFYLAKTDIAALLVNFQNNLLLGLDLTRALGGAGFWVEGAYVLVKALTPNFRGDKKNYLRLTIGSDYSFRNGLYAFVEYHYNGAGARYPRDYLQVLTRPGVSEGAVYLLGKHYLTPGFSYPVTPLLTFTTQALINLSDPSFFIAPVVEYNIAENVYLSGGAFISLGESPRIVVPPFPEFRSEFGGYPSIFYSSFRVYF